jgi:hypothetical protein
MRLVFGCLIVGWLCVGNVSAPARADGGALLVSARKGGYGISVFTAPTPFRAGPVDFSVLVQDASTGEPLPDARVTVWMTKPRQAPLQYEATREAATNKLFRAAQFVLPEAGRWDVRVQIDGAHGTAMFGAAIDAATRVPQWQEMWPWFGWPVLVIALFAAHQTLSRRANPKNH